MKYIANSTLRLGLTVLLIANVSFGAAQAESRDKETSQQRHEKAVTGAGVTGPTSSGSQIQLNRPPPSSTMPSRAAVPLGQTNSDTGPIKPPATNAVSEPGNDQQLLIEIQTKTNSLRYTDEAKSSAEKRAGCPPNCLHDKL